MAKVISVGFWQKKGHKVFGIDFCPGLIENAKSLEEKKSLGIKYSIDDIRRTNFPASYFDVVISHQTINEIPDPEKAFKEFWRILRKRGKVICLFLHPCFDFPLNKFGNKPFSLTYFQKSAIKKGVYLVGGIKSPAPYFYLHLSLSDWSKIIERAGFSNLKIREPHPPLSLLGNNKWWQENFKKPRFILIEATKI